MAQIYNSQLTKELIEAVKIQTSHDKVPNEIADKVIPTVETNPRLLHNSEQIYFSTSDSQNLLIVPTGKKFYITFAQITGATITAGTATIDITTPAATTSFIALVMPAATVAIDALHGNTTQSFNFPIKLNAGDSLDTGAGGGFASTAYVVGGYFVEDN